MAGTRLSGAKQSDLLIIYVKFGFQLYEKTHLFFTRAAMMTAVRQGCIKLEGRNKRGTLKN